MKVAVLLLVIVTALAEELPAVAPPVAAQPRAQPVVLSSEEQPVVAIVHNQQHEPDAEGSHSSDFEAENGIKFQFSGSQGVEGGSNMVGVYSYPMDDGTVAEVSFVADENGFQPQSNLLPVAPAFPHEIPQFVLDQIAFAEEERKRKEREGTLPQ
ncbi:cuticle protein AMP4-like [Panulirus ornatus]|uniref:cuticle protein AMP4-like n=1 Tax=Panulirus ornatus TaxID=150431 RepID=UPI003A8A9DCC